MPGFDRKPKRFGNGGGKPGGFNRGGGRPSFNRGGRDSDGPKEMFETICSNCQKPCEVPFRPNGSKPVYCKDCFRSMRDEDEGMHSTRPERAPRRDFSPAPARPQQDSRIDNLGAQINALHQKMDKVLAALQIGKTESAPAAPVVVADEEETFTLSEEPVAKKAPAKKKFTPKKK